MKIALLLHIYQPPTQEEEVFRKIYTQSYQPLLKFLKSKKNVSLTLNVPLSLLEQMDSYGYKEWLADLKDLYRSERVELTGSCAYHPLMPKLSAGDIEKQIITNEYGLGYFFGNSTGFEGEPGIIAKNIKGFFPPECAVSDEVLRSVSDLNYEWVLVDQTAFEGGADSIVPNSYYTFDTTELKVIPRDKNLSDALSFSRNNDVAAVIRSITDGEGCHIIALDAETFGHHNIDGFYLLEELAEQVAKKGGFFKTISHIIPFLEERKITKVKESTWGASFQDMSENRLYPFWSGNELQGALYELEGILSKYANSYEDAVDFASFDVSTGPLWRFNSTAEFPANLKNYLGVSLSNMKFQHSDKYWWASKKQILGNPSLYHPLFIKKALSYAEDVLKYSENVGTAKEMKEIKKIEGLINKIRNMLES